MHTSPSFNFETPAGFENRKAPQTASEEGAEYGTCLLKFIDYCEESFMLHANVRESLTMRKIQFYIRTTHVWLEFGHALMARASRCQNLKEISV